jgi:hypothetical protein
MNLEGSMSCLQGEVAFMSAYSIHQLHIFIFVLAVFHILYCIITLALGTTKVLNSLAFSKDLNSSLNRFNLLKYIMGFDELFFKCRSKDGRFGRTKEGHLNLEAILVTNGLFKKLA